MNRNAAQNIWWVNQGSTYKQSREGGFLWSPIWDGNGIERAYWKTMAEVRVDDVIVHCTKGKIVGLGRATSEAYQSNRPADFPQPSELEALHWGKTSVGRRVNVEYFDLEPPIPVESVASRITALNIAKGPLDKNEKPKQSYLHKFTRDGLRILREASPGYWPEWALDATEADKVSSVTHPS
jgi:hypothetical protein